jgi:DNA processing protein
MTDSVPYWLALREVDGIGDRLCLRLVSDFASPEAVFGASVSRLAEVEGISEEQAARIREQKNGCLKQAEEHLRKAAAAGAEAVAYDDPRYPRYLKEIYDPPAFFYAKGHLDLLANERAMAVVGTRRATAFGRKMARDIAGALAARGVLIVSGMARGIDAEAHEAAMEAGTTVGVLGCGVDVLYPPENKRLFETMAEKALLISEFSPGTEPSASNFPKRNRVLAGLAAGVVVVEASEKSGALITARLALDSNRSVFAVPGYPTSPQSRGCNMLLKQGAQLVETWEDVAEHLPVLGLRPESDHASAPPVEFASEEEKMIYQQLSLNDPVHIDRLAEKTGYSISTLLTHLLALEIRDVVEQVPGKLFLRKG